MKTTESIKLNREFSFVCRRGKKYNGKLLAVYVWRRKLSGRRIGITVSKGYRTSVARNRGKRLLREAYRSLEDEVADRLDLILMLRYTERLLKMEVVRRDLAAVLEQAGLLNKREKAAVLPRSDLDGQPACPEI